MDGEEGAKLSFEQQKKSMRNSTADGMAYSVTAGLGDAYLPAAIIALGASNFYVGLLAAMPQLFGALLQSFSIAAIRLVKSRKALVMAGAAVQAACWLPVIALLLWPGALSVPLIIFFFSLGAGASLFVNPAWSSWISDIVPDNGRAMFFARRNRLMQMVLFVSTFLAGIALREMQLQYPAALAFAAVFCVSFLARLSTLFFHSRTSDVPYALQLMREIKLKHLFLLPAHRKELWFLAFMGLMNFTVQFAAPFFTPYMIGSLHYDMGMLGMMTAVAVLAKIAAYPYWAWAISRFGNRIVLVATALMAPLVPLLWLLSTGTLQIGIFQAFSGFTWAGFELASFNFALALVGREVRPSFISKYNAFNGVFYAAGCIAGGLFLTGSPDFALFGYSGILLVFLISGAMRAAVVLFFAPKLASSHEAEKHIDQRAMALRLVAVYPTQGAVHQLMDGWDVTKKAVARGASRSERALSAGAWAALEVARDACRKMASAIMRKKRL